jgi:hypothetical protein
MDPVHHERFQNGPENKIHIKESSFWISESFWSLSVLYRKVLEGSRVGPTWAHLTEAYMGVRGSVLATLGQAHQAPKAQSASPKGKP